MTPKISVCMITCNHKDFIAKAIDSVLMQILNCEYELIVGDDASTDGTREILIEYQKKYPRNIKLILHPQRNPGQPGAINFVVTIKKALGEYIAMLEGDDYWTDPYKLQYQLDYLDQNKDCECCFTNYSEVDESGKLILLGAVPANKRRKLNQNDIISSYCLPLYTLMIRNHIILEFPHQYYQTLQGDYFISCMITENGYAGYIDSNTACYRKHAGGVWSRKTMEEMLNDNTEALFALLHYYKKRYQDVLVVALNMNYLELMRCHYLSKNIILMIKNVFDAIRLNIVYMNIKVIILFVNIIGKKIFKMIQRMRFNLMLIK